jgi:type 1 glutamine amidotransferase/sugar phosphate isomerase/epimerase
MKNVGVFLAIFAGAIVGLAVSPAQQTGAQPKKLPDGGSLEERTGKNRVTWRTRTLVGNDRLMQWKTGPGATVFASLTFLEAVAKTDALGLDAIEGSNTQKVSPSIRKNLDYKLTAEELAAVTDALKTANVALRGYHVDKLTPDRKVFEFAKAVGAATISGNPDPAAIPGLDKLANEFKITVAIENDDPKSVTALQGSTKMIGIVADTGAWMQRGITPLDGLALVKDRLVAVRLRDRNARGLKGRDVILGSGAAAMPAFFSEMNRLDLRPLFLTLESTGAGDSAAEMAKTADAFEKSVQPTLGAFVDTASKSMPIHSGDSLPADVKARIDAAIPRTAYVKPKQPRKLLVIDACVANMSHNTIPHFNLAIELMGKYTGAFQPVFSNDLDNLKWPKIKEWDAIYLNDTVGELFPDLEIRQSLLRYVREGGGIGGWHGSGWASRNWPELGEMMGAADGPHRIEPGYVKLDDAKSPINQAFDGTGIEHTEEFYRFHESGPTAYYSRDKVHVLLSMDLAKSPAMSKPGKNGDMLYMRSDGDIAVAWIRSYGKGRVYYNSMGHMPETMMSKAIMGHVLAAIQFLVGDLDADTTPSARLAAKK